MQPQPGGGCPWHLSGLIAWHCCTTTGGRLARDVLGSVHLTCLIKTTFMVEATMSTTLAQGPRPSKVRSWLNNLNKYIYKISKNHSKTFFQCFYICSVKNAVIYTFFGLKSVQNTGFLQCFQCSGIQKTIQNIAIYSVFSFLSVFPLPEADQNDPKFRFNGLLSSDTQKSSKKNADTTLPRSRCEIPVSVRNRFCPPPPS